MTNQPNLRRPRRPKFNPLRLFRPPEHHWMTERLQQEKARKQSEEKERQQKSVQDEFTKRGLNSLVDQISNGDPKRLSGSSWDEAKLLHNYTGHKRSSSDGAPTSSSGGVSGRASTIDGTNNSGGGGNGQMNEGTRTITPTTTTTATATTTPALPIQGKDQRKLDTGTALDENQAKRTSLFNQQPYPTPSPSEPLDSFSNTPSKIGSLTNFASSSLPTSTPSSNSTNSVSNVSNSTSPAITPTSSATTLDSLPFTSSSREVEGSEGINIPKGTEGSNLLAPPQPMCGWCLLF